MKAMTLHNNINRVSPASLRPDFQKCPKVDFGFSKVHRP